jgi:hypothetical protein
MTDPPEQQPELIAALRVGFVVSGECSAWHRNIIVKRIHVETRAELQHILKEAFAEHLGEQHRPDSQSNCGMSTVPGRPAQGQVQNEYADSD